MQRLNDSIKSHTWLIVLTGVLFSFIFPQAGTFIKPYLNYLLMVMMFLSCLDLKIPEIIKSLGDYKNITLMLVIVHMVSPLIVFLLRDYFSPQIFLGLIIASTIPAGRSSVFLSNIYGGIPIKALVSTSISNFFSPILVTSIVWTFAHTTVQIDTSQIGWTIFTLVIIPLLIAVVVGRSPVGRQLNLYSPSISVFLLFFIILGIISPLKSVVADNLQLSLILSIIVTVLISINFCLGYLLGNNHHENITYAISSSYKNYTLATLLSLTLFSPIVALPAIIYTIMSNLLLIPLQLFLKPQTTIPAHHHHRRRNLNLFVIGLIATFIIAKSSILDSYITALGPYPLLAAFIGGMLIASTFTIATGILILVRLSSFYSPLLLVIFGSFGAVCCDAVIFTFVRHKVVAHVTPIYRSLISRSHLHKLLHTHYFAWTLPVVGAILMATPLSDELAVSILSLSKISPNKFLLLAMVSHLIGLGLMFTIANTF